MNYLRIIKTIFSRHPNMCFAFGSHVKGTHKTFSDLDWCDKANISDAKIAALQEELEQSDLPFTVDIVSWNRCSSEFAETHYK